MLISNLLVYYPFRSRMDVLFRNFDGPFYMYVAKTLYRMPAEARFDDPLENKYYASHLPAYPLLIRFVSLFTANHYPAAMLITTTLCSIVAAILFYHLLRIWKVVASPFWTACLFCFFPPRWLIYHSVGASEPMLLCFIFGAFLALHQNKTWLSTLLILLASLTRIMGILLLPVFLGIYIWKKEFKKIPVLLLSGMGLLALFFFYQAAFGDFFAYFRHNLQDKGMIQLYPLEVFRFYASKINFHTSELYFLLYAIYGLGTILLWEHKPFFIYSVVFFVFACFIYHFDLPRHFIPLSPFAVLIAYDRYLSKFGFKIFLAPLLLYLCYTYVWGWLPYPLLSKEGYEQLLIELAR